MNAETTFCLLMSVLISTSVNMAGVEIKSRVRAPSELRWLLIPQELKRGNDRWEVIWLVTRFGMPRALHNLDSTTVVLCQQVAAAQ